jgi:hypothetical protein
MCVTETTDRVVAHGQYFHKGTFRVVEMFFRPNFCANCGERVERAEWGLLTSRRFCYVCESEYKGHDLIPRFVVGLGIAIGIFGFGSYLKSGPMNPGPDAAARQSLRVAGQKLQEKRASNVENAGDQRVMEQPKTEPATTEKGQIHRPNEQQSGPIAASVKPVIAEQAYFCGAETKKGTPCSRRVKGNVRCYQHHGMPAMPKAEK